MLKTNSMATISFLYRSTRDSSFLKVSFFHRVDGKNVFFESTLKTIVEKEYWDKFHFAKRISDIKIKNRQTELLQELNAIENHVFNKYKFYTGELNKKWLDDVIDSFYNADQLVVSELLVDWIDEYKKDKSKSVSARTLEKADTVKRIVQLMEVAWKYELKVKDIDVSFVRRYEAFCYEMGYAANTIARNLSYIKTVCRHAFVNGVEVSNTLSLVRTKKERVENIYLTEEEIEKIAKCDKLFDYLDNARDWLLISCYTGQRVSDFMRFDKSMIRKQKNKKGKNVVFLDFTQAKTNKLMSIPLSKKVLSILEKRGGDFPRAISDQRYNEYIKKVCELSGIVEEVFGNGRKQCEDKKWRIDKGMFKKYELVSSHIGRRSFATNNYGKIPTVLLMSMTGHSSEKMFLTYIGKGSNDLTMELSEYFD